MVVSENRGLCEHGVALAIRRVGVIEPGVKDGILALTAALDAALHLAAGSTVDDDDLACIAQDQLSQSQDVNCKFANCNLQILKGGSSWRLSRPLGAGGQAQERFLSCA